MHERAIKSLLEDYDNRRIAIVLGLLSLTYFLFNVDFLMRGDATTYATYMLLGKFDDITLHNGYYFALYALHHWVASPLGVPIHETLALANVAFGAVSVTLVYILFLQIAGDRFIGVLTAVLFALSGRVLMNASSSEIYMLQTLCTFGSMVLYVRGRPFLAGLSAGASLLVSPLSAFAFLFFPVWDATAEGKIRIKPFVFLVLGGTLVYLPYLIVCWQELLWGRRGLLIVREAAPPNVKLLLMNSVKYQVKHYTALWALLLGVPWSGYANRRVVLLSLSVAIPHLYIVAKLTGEDHTFLLNVDPFIALWLAIGAASLWCVKRWRWLVPACVAVHLIVYVKSGTVFNGNHNAGYAREIRAIVKQYLAGQQAVMITDWDVAISATHFGRDVVRDIPEREPLFSQMYDLTNTTDPQPTLERRTIYVLDPWSPSPINRLLRSPEALNELAEEMSIRSQAERKFGLQCRLLVHGTHDLYKCSQVGDSGDAG